MTNRWAKTMGGMDSNRNKKSIDEFFNLRSVQGERYFNCRPNYGIFVRPGVVEIGDFPVEEIDLGDEEM